ncbi:MAG TPA: MFS transporter [Candidatus Nanoarchaeia archaeon]|nr:MFS transporter [Candidatus Nanoarchaeia archaeon]
MAKIDKNVYLLGIVSFLTDVSSEMIFAVFSIFFTVVLGASTVLLGLIEGLADFAASSLDYISGVISDRTGKRRLPAAIGYGFSTLAKIMLVFANSAVLASIFRVTERLGKSFRGPPRDAWLSSLTTDANRGLSFGVHKAFDKAGAVIGPFIAYFLLRALGQSMGTFKLLFLIALVPAAASVIFLLFVKEKPEKKEKRENIFTAYRNLSSGYKHFLKTAGIFSLAYFSFGFLLLKAYIVGFAIEEVVLLYALFNVAFVIFAAPLGRLGDRIGRKKLIVIEYAIYILMSIGFIFASTKMAVIVLFVIFGIFYSIDESQSKVYIADLEKTKRGTAVGLYNFFTGLIYLPASLIAGWLWKINPNYAFIFAGVVALGALAYFVKPRFELSG